MWRPPDAPRRSYNAANEELPSRGVSRRDAGRFLRRSSTYRWSWSSASGWSSATRDPPTSRQPREPAYRRGRRTDETPGLKPGRARATSSPAEGETLMPESPVALHARRRPVRCRPSGLDRPARDRPHGARQTVRREGHPVHGRIQGRPRSGLARAATPSTASAPSHGRRGYIRDDRHGKSRPVAPTAPRSRAWPKPPDRHGRSSRTSAPDELSRGRARPTNRRREFYRLTPGQKKIDRHARRAGRMNLFIYADPNHRDRAVHDARQAPRRQPRPPCRAVEQACVVPATAPA